MKTSKWRALIRRLRKHFPVEAAVSVCRRPVKCDCGLTTFDGRTYRIRINSDLSEQAQIDALLHEWAHVAAIDEAYRHRGRWATVHGEIYDAFCRNFAPSEPPRN